MSKVDLGKRNIFTIFSKRPKLSKLVIYREIARTFRDPLRATIDFLVLKIDLESSLKCLSRVGSHILASSIKKGSNFEISVHFYCHFFVIIGNS